MGNYILRRLIQALPTLLFLTMIAFTFISLAPGDVVDAMIDLESAQALGPEWLEQRREALGLNDPVPVQYARWLGEVVQGNFGYSILRQRPVTQMIGERLWATIRLGGFAIVLATIVGVSAGLVSGMRQYSKLDHIISILSYGAYSFPNFFMGLLAIYVFAVRLQWLPSAGMFSPGEERTIADTLKHLILPVTVLGTQFIGIFARQTRSAVLEVLNQDYVRTAHAKGLHSRTVTVQHIFPNALIPIITVVGFSLPLLLTGAVVTEIVFSWSGIGKLTVDSIYGRDYPVIMGVVLLIGVGVTLANLAVDISYGFIDPRIRYD